MLGRKGRVHRKRRDVCATRERYTLKFTPAVNHKDLMKHFQDGNGFDEAQLAKLHQMKARIELLCGPEDLKKIDELLRELSRR